MQGAGAECCWCHLAAASVICVIRANKSSAGLSHGLDPLNPQFATASLLNLQKYSDVCRYSYSSALCRSAREETSNCWGNWSCNSTTWYFATIKVPTTSQTLVVGDAVGSSYCNVRVFVWSRLNQKRMAPLTVLLEAITISMHIIMDTREGAENIIFHPNDIALYIYN